MSSRDSVRVVLRARPLGATERQEGCNTCISFSEDGKQVVFGKDRGFTFDAVYPPETPQEAIYDDWVTKLVDGCLQGYNATILAYGQTGAGKTYTMGTAHSASAQDADCGIIPRVFHQLFESIHNQEDSNVHFSVRASFIEIYNEEIKDLLHPSTQSKALAIRERSDGTIVMAGVSDESVTSCDDLTLLLDNGSAARTVGSTHMNQHSSRSHAIFTVVVERHVLSNSSLISATDDSMVNNESNADNYRSAKFHLVDLAGSERAKRTGNIGVRLKESVNINSGLLALGNVISALGDPKKKAHHVPYRESKLTRMLQDSLGGNSRTLMIACISPADINFEETLNTLKYANRARNIRNNPVINRNKENAMVAGMQDEIERLRGELTRAKEMNVDPSGGVLSTTYEMEVDEIQRALESEQERRRRAENRIDNLERDKAALSESLSEMRFEFQSIGKILADALNHGSMEIIRASVESVDKRIRQFNANLDASSRQSNRPVTAPSRNSDRTSSRRDPERQTFQSLSSATSEMHEDHMERGMASVVARNQATIRTLQQDLFSSQQVREQQVKEIRELKEELHRDEQIFAEKQRELKRASAQVTQLQENVDKLQRELESARTAKRELQGSRPASAPAREMSDSLSDTLHRGPRAFAAMVEDDDEVQLDDDDLPAQENVQIGISELEEENMRIQAEKAAIEQEKREVEQQANALAKRFQREQQLAESQLRNLEFNIKQKEELIKTLVSKEQGLTKENERASYRISQLEKDLAAVRVPDEIAREKEDELLRLRRAQESYMEMQREKTVSARKIKEMEAEVGRMRAEQEGLKRAAKTAAEEFQQKRSRNDKQLSEFMRRADKRIHDQELLIEKQRTQLARQNEELKAMAKKQRGGGVGGRDNASTRGDGKGASSRPSSASNLAAELAARRQWLDKEIEDHLARVAETDKLERELRRKEQIIQEKEATWKEHTNLELKAERSKTAIRASLIDLNQKISKLDEDLRDKEELLLTRRGTSLVKLSEEVEELQRQRQIANDEKEALEEKAQNQQFLSEDEVEALRELEDRMEGLDAEIEFKDSEIQKLEKSIGQRGRKSEMPDVQGLSRDDLQAMLEQYMKKLAAVSELERKRTIELQRLEVTLEEKNNQAEALENTIRQAEMTKDRELTRQQKDYEAKIAYLLKQVTANTKPKVESSESEAIQVLNRKLQFFEDQNSILEKDNYYYKHSNKELKRKLRELNAASDHEQQEFEHVRKQVRALQTENQQLRDHVRNLKTFVQKNGLVSSVRLSAKDLRPLSEKAVEDLSASASQPTPQKYRERDQDAQEAPTRDSQPRANRDRVPSRGPSRLSTTLDADRNELYGMDVDAGDSVLLE